MKVKLTRMVVRFGNACKSFLCHTILYVIDHFGAYRHHVFRLQAEFMVLPTFVRFIPKWLGGRLLDLYPKQAARELKGISYMMHDTSKRILDEKRASLTGGNAFLEHKIGKGKDLMSVLCMRLLPTSHLRLTNPRYSSPVKENTFADADDRLPEEEILGQMS